jgi:hypothetical protein
MPLPRNVIAKNRNMHIKNSLGRDITKKTTELDTICDRHQVGNLSFKDCKYANAEGNVTFVEHEHIRGNMKIGALIIKANALLPSTDSVYDLVQLEKDKKERDEKKMAEEEEKSRNEVQRLQNTNSLDILPDGNEYHNELIQKLINEESQATENGKDQPNENSNDQPNENSNDQPNENSNEQPIENSNEQPIENSNDQPIENSNDQPIENNITNDNEVTAIEEKRRKALKQMREELDKKSRDNSGNKYYRKFMKDIRGKFTLTEESNIKYLEVRAETTNMVIENVKAYKIIMPEKIKHQYILFIGDLQMKSDLLRKIDPAYGFDKISREHNDLFERIKAKENSKTEEYDEKITDDELDDLEELNVSDEEYNNDSSQLINNSN